MSRKKMSKKTYTYECTMSGQSYKTTREAPSSQNLLSVDAFYEMHPEEDDRPELIKKQRKEQKEQKDAFKALFDAPAATTVIPPANEKK